MKINNKLVAVCDCEGTMSLNGATLAKACGGTPAAEVSTQLCRAQIATYQRLLKSGETLLVGCTQEAPLFEELRGEAGAADGVVRYVNIRERAGWSDEAQAATPKIAALLAEAALDIPETGSVALESKGVTLVYGRDE